MVISEDFVSEDVVVAEVGVDEKDSDIKCKIPTVFSRYNVVTI